MTSPGPDLTGAPEAFFDVCVCGHTLWWHDNGTDGCRHSTGTFPPYCSCREFRDAGETEEKS